jgi:hypothetical protein
MEQVSLPIYVVKTNFAIPAPLRLLATARWKICRGLAITASSPRAVDANTLGTAIDLRWASLGYHAEHLPDVLQTVPEGRRTTIDTEARAEIGSETCRKVQ